MECLARLFETALLTTSVGLSSAPLNAASAVCDITHSPCLWVQSILGETPRSVQPGVSRREQSRVSNSSYKRKTCSDSIIPLQMRVDVAKSSAAFDAVVVLSGDHVSTTSLKGAAVIGTPSINRSKQSTAAHFAPRVLSIQLGRTLQSWRLQSIPG